MQKNIKKNNQKNQAPVIKAIVWIELNESEFTSEYLFFSFSFLDDYF
jgi:hypothetical protein